ncbi:MAG TPA: hypothetical protein VFW65_18970 [Pseudonocardiaceae bacterium]|nr:hypothetical protein [Pseudonocardiaceae bacterium]
MLCANSISAGAAILSLEHQLHLSDVLGQHSWHVDLTTNRFEFAGARTVACTGYHLVGTASAGAGSWLWGWANPSGFPESLTALSAGVRDFGQHHGIPGLATAEIPFGSLPGASDDPNRAAHLCLDAAKAVSGHWTAYQGDVGGGTIAAFLVEHPEFELPAPEPARTMRVLQQALAEIPITDHRRALYGYASRRPLAITFAPDQTTCTLTGRGFATVAEFDDRGRVTTMSGQLSAPTQR